MKVVKSFLHAVGLTLALSIISMFLTDHKNAQPDIYMFVPVFLALAFPITWRLFYVRLEKKSAKESTIKESDAPVVPNGSIEENAGALDLKGNENTQALQGLRFFGECDNGKTILGVCDKCNSSHTFNQSAIYKTETGYAINPTVKCSCGITYDKILGHVPQTINASPQQNSTKPTNQDDATKAGGTLAGVAFAIIVYLFVFGGYERLSTFLTNDTASNNNAPTPAAVASLKDKKASLSIGAENLYSAFEENLFAADDKYKGKIIIVSGVVKDIGKDIIGNMYITLEGGDDILQTVQCFFTEDKHLLKQAKKGYVVKVKGRCAGKHLNVSLQDCVFILD